jgi:hypothetical protein
LGRGALRYFVADDCSYTHSGHLHVHWRQVIEGIAIELLDRSAVLKALGICERTPETRVIAAHLRRREWSGNARTGETCVAHHWLEAQFFSDSLA